MEQPGHASDACGCRRASDSLTSDRNGLPAGGCRDCSGRQGGGPAPGTGLLGGPRDVRRTMRCASDRGIRANVVVGRGAGGLWANSWSVGELVVGGREAGGLWANSWSVVGRLVVRGGTSGRWRGTGGQSWPEVVEQVVRAVEFVRVEGVTDRETLGSDHEMRGGP